MTFLNDSERARLESTLREQGWKRPDSAAVIVCCGEGRTALVAYIGYCIEGEIDAIGYHPADIGLDGPPGNGIWMWEGRYVGVEYPSTPNGPAEYDSYAEGEWRRLTPDEFERLRDGKPIWNPEDWYTEKELAEMRAEEGEG